MNKKTIFEDLGNIAFKKAWDYQESLFNKLIQFKNNEGVSQNYLLFCEHPPVFTLGKSGSEGNLLRTKDFLKKHKIDFFKTNRGGDITFHGPGQIVVYPIFNLEHFHMGVKKYIHALEEVIIKTLQDYKIKSERLEKATGIWLDAQGKNPRKICAIGVRISRNITMHGFAFNINTNLDYYNYINPCGITDKNVTSLKHELQKEVDLNTIKEKLKYYFLEVFGVNYISL